MHRSASTRKRSIAAKKGYRNRIRFFTFDYNDKRPFVASVNTPTEHVWLLNPNQAEVRRTRNKETKTLIRFKPTLAQEAAIDSGNGTIVIKHHQIEQPQIASTRPRILLLRWGWKPRRGKRRRPSGRRVPWS